MTRSLILAVLAAIMVLLAACGGDEDEEPVELPTSVPVFATVAQDSNEQSAADESITDESTVEERDGSDDTAVASNSGPGRRQGMGGRMMGNGMSNSMREYHTLSVPDEYAALSNPIPVDEASIARGRAHFNQFCASCHGSTGRGDGPAAANLDPAPPMIAQTSLMLGDDFLFWRISEGGAFEPFNSSMPGWKAILDEEARWDVINYARTLSGMDGMGEGQPGNGPMRAQMQAAMHDEVVTAGIEQGIIDAVEGETFIQVHDQLDAYRATLAAGTNDPMEAMMDEWLAAIVESGELTQANMDAFIDVHARLEAAGLMP